MYERKPLLSPKTVKALHDWNESPEIGKPVQPPERPRSPEIGRPVPPVEPAIGVRRVGSLDRFKPKGVRESVGSPGAARTPDPLASQHTVRLPPNSRPISRSPDAKPERGWIFKTVVSCIAGIAIAGAITGVYKFNGQISETLGIELFKDPVTAAPPAPASKADPTPKSSDDAENSSPGESTTDSSLTSPVEDPPSIAAPPAPPAPTAPIPSGAP